MDKVRIFNKGKNDIDTAEGLLKQDKGLNVSKSLAKILVEGYQKVVYADSMTDDSGPAEEAGKSIAKKEVSLNEREKRIKEAEEALGITGDFQEEGTGVEDTPPEPPKEPGKPGDESGKKRGRPRK